MAVPNFIHNKRLRNRLLLNAMIGLCIAIVVHRFSDNAIISAIDDAAMDLMIEWNVGIHDNSERAIPFVYVDIDEKTYRKWGEPPQIPRANLAALLEFVLNGNPRMVVLDVDTRGKPGQLVPLTVGERNLAEIVARGSKQNESLDESPGSEVPIILALNTRKNLDYPAGLKERRESILKSVINQTDFVYEGSTLFDKSVSDHVVRRWRMFEQTCNDSKGGVIASLAVQAFAILYCSGDERRNLDQFLEQRIPRNCPVQEASQIVVNAEGMPNSFSCAGNQIKLNRSDRLLSRVIYSIEWKNNQVVDGGSLEYQGGSGPLVWYLPAHYITDNTSSALSNSMLTGRIVVIGGSFVDGRDFHSTPIGMMPGALVLINTMQSLFQYGYIQKPSWELTLLLEGCLIILAALAFAVMESFTAKVLTTLAIVFGLIPISFLLFKDGIWLGFALPVVAIQILDLLYRVQRIIKQDVNKKV